MIQPTKLGWMAGIIDMRGKFVYKANKTRKTAQITMYVETRHIAVIRELSSLTGVSPEPRRQVALKDFMRRGCAEHCPDSHVHVTDEGRLPEIARWTITGAGLAVILFNLLPFLLMEKEYEKVYKEIVDNTPLKGQGSAAVIASIRRLAMLGWDLPPQFSEVDLL